MTRLNRPARMNRSLLGLIAVLLLAGGAFLGLANHGRIPGLDTAAPLVPGTEQPPQWVLVVIVAAGVLIGLLCLRWLLAQTIAPATPRTHRWRVHEDRSGKTDLEAAKAAEPFAREVQALDGVTGAKAVLGGRRGDPLLSLVVEAEPDADLVAVRRRITDELLPRMRSAVDLDELPTAIEFRVPSAAAARVN
ncbi:alkaline shock response membrane anchor protein AmaP [Pseudonocardiaceae bacterium YIM PH 21723]|nr:alkaline shock response membrane anchor protein AmaP [Pseudonocardiaceae bacterium YIM PH 21723]